MAITRIMNGRISWNGFVPYAMQENTWLTNNAPWVWVLAFEVVQ